MLDRFAPRVLLLIGLALPIAGCTSSQVDSLTVTPTTITMAVGTTAQLTAIGTYGHGNHPSTTADLTDQVAWSTASVDVATVSATGVVTATGPGIIQITASINGYTGKITASTTITVTGSGGSSSTGATLTSIAIIPSSQSVAKPTQTSQFICIGTTSASTTVNLTNQVLWTSSSQQIATIGAATGLATAVGQGTTTITALYSSGGLVLTATATFTVLGGTTEQFTAVTIVPGSQSVSASGQTGQFIALATSGTTGLEEDVTNSPQIKWLSSIPSVATVTSGLTSGDGVAAGVSQGTSTITAELTNPDNSLVTSTASVNVTLTPAPEPLLSLIIVPSTITVDNLLDNGQFLAIGTYSVAPTVRDLTNSVTWSTSSPSVFPVNTNGSGSANPGADAGVVTAYGDGGATIIAEATDAATGSIQTATAQFNCPLVLPTPTTAGSCYPGSEASALLATLTIYNEGLNTTNWLVTAPSATNTPNVLHCGPGSNGAGLGGSVCVATYPVGTTVTLTAPAGAGAFGGWSYNCIPTSAVTAGGPNSCTVTMTFDDTVGAIFN
jgi:hypothetical protein